MGAFRGVLWPCGALEKGAREPLPAPQGPRTPLLKPHTCRSQAKSEDAAIETALLALREASERLTALQLALEKSFQREEQRLQALEHMLQLQGKQQQPAVELREILFDFHSTLKRSREELEAPQKASFSMVLAV